MVSWFTGIDGETAAWMGIAAAILIGTNLGLLYWDRYLNKFHNEQEAKR